MKEFIHPIHKIPVKLGRTIARRTGRSRLRSKILTSFIDSMPLAPDSFDASAGITDWGMMMNDQLGDCTIAGPGHLIMSWTKLQTGTAVVVPDSSIVSAYEQFDGYVLGDPSTDQGGDMLTVLNDWQQYGIGGHQITAHAEVNMTQMRIQQGVWLFRGLDCAVDLPISAQDQVGKTWDISGDGKTGNSAPGSWGGHCVPIVQYDTLGLTCVTWGMLQRISWRFFMLYFNEAHAIITPDFTNPDFPLDMVTHDLLGVGT
jgi:hypothetical protein